MVLHSHFLRIFSMYFILKTLSKVHYASTVYFFIYTRICIKPKRLTLVTVIPIYKVLSRVIPDR